MSPGAEARGYVREARERKSFRMAFLCWANGVSLQSMKNADEGQWAMLHSAIQRPGVPSEETRFLTLVKLEQLEERAKALVA